MAMIIAMYRTPEVAADLGNFATGGVEGFFSGPERSEAAP